MTIIAFTGHRPQKIGGYDINSEQRRKVRHVLRGAVGDGAITGGALGVDQDAAMAMSDRGIPYIVAAPCVRQWSRWPQASVDLYQQICRDSSPELLQEILDNMFQDMILPGMPMAYKGHPLATRHGVVYTYANEYPGPWVMQRRNEFMVDNCDHLYAIWDGSPGGTANCVRYAEQVGVPVTNLWDELGF